MGLDDWKDSDKAADAASGLSDAMVKLLLIELKRGDDGGFNTPGYVDVALILLSLCKSDIFRNDDIAALAGKTLAIMLKKQKGWFHDGQLDEEYKRLAKRLTKLVQVLNQS